MNRTVQKERDLLRRDGVEDVDLPLVHQRQLLRRRAQERLRRRRVFVVAGSDGRGMIVAVGRGLRRHRLGIGRSEWAGTRERGAGLSVHARVEDGV